MISGILAGGIPGFRMVLCCFTHSLVWPGGLGVLFFVVLPYHTEMIQGYHLLHQLTYFTHELEPVTLLVCLCGLCFCFCVFVLCLCLVPCFCFVLCLGDDVAEGTATFETYLGQRPGRRP